METTRREGRRRGGGRRGHRERRGGKRKRGTGRCVVGKSERARWARKSPGFMGDAQSPDTLADSHNMLASLNRGG